MIKRWIQKFKCLFPLTQPPFGFWHGKCAVVEQLSPWSQRIICMSCGKRFAINHSAEIVLPWEGNVQDFYDDPIWNENHIEWQ